MAKYDELKRQCLYVWSSPEFCKTGCVADSSTDLSVLSSDAFFAAFSSTLILTFRLNQTSRVSCLLCDIPVLILESAHFILSSHAGSLLIKLSMSRYWETRVSAYNMSVTICPGTDHPQEIGWTYKWEIKIEQTLCTKNSAPHWVSTGMHGEWKISLQLPIDQLFPWQAGLAKSFSCAFHDDIKSLCCLIKTTTIPLPDGLSVSLNF